MTDQELKRVIVFMANKSGGSFPNPDEGAAAPAEAAASDATPAEGEAAAAPAEAAPAAEAAAPAAAGVDGKAVYDGLCMACHAAGVAGAPKVGDAADWKERLAQGKDTLYKHSIEGFTGKKGMMPAKGGNPSLTDEEIKAAVDYMIK